MPNGRFRSELPELRRLFLARTSPLVPKRGRHGGNSVFPGISSHVFSKQEYKAIRLAAQERGQTPNDALTQGMFEALRDWNVRNGRAIRYPALTVMVPMDLREASTAGETRDLSACNCVTYALIRRRGKVLKESERLGDSLTQELSELKHNRHTTRFMNLIVGAQNRPQWRKRLMKLSPCLATAVLSNTGDPTRSFHATFPRSGGKISCGNLVLDDISGVPPMRKRTHVTASIFTYRRQLKICLRCSPLLYSQDDTREFLNLYVQRLVA
jgi:hypothetical protein